MILYEFEYIGEINENRPDQLFQLDQKVGYKAKSKHLPFITCSYKTWDRGILKLNDRNCIPSTNNNNNDKNHTKVRSNRHVVKTHCLALKII